MPSPLLAWLIWFSYRAGKNNASVTTAQAATDSATAITEKAEAMAQAQADKPAPEDGVLARLDGTDAEVGDFSPAAFSPSGFGSTGIHLSQDAWPTTLMS
ncbi:hypothetical protein [Gluconobacter thailandicus]|uniref:Uncharacterized protein n=1 Tax=Gluconobacter thailandicus TaxID=257438 RepID=A0AAP9JJE7_GLUTH|nr:hypothetical protein [Gluconobacter thailandicus]QEH97339.1 hypothetical protein FXF46_14565 [Gluconobacter thailandicus]